MTVIMMPVMIMMMSPSLEGEVESQRQQRLSDAKQVEAKAARIKVTLHHTFVHCNHNHHHYNAL